MLRLTFLFLLAKKQNNWKYVIQLNWGKTILVFFHLINLKEFREISLSNLTTELFLHYICKISKFPCFYNSHQTYWDFANFAGGGGSVCSSPGLVNGPMSNQNSPGLCNGPMSSQNSPGLCNGSMSSHNSPLSNQNSPGNYQPYTRPILRVHTFFFIKALVKTPTLRGHATKNIQKVILLCYCLDVWRGWLFEGAIRRLSDVNTELLLSEPDYTQGTNIFRNKLLYALFPLTFPARIVESYIIFVFLYYGLALSLKTFSIA